MIILWENQYFQKPSRKWPCIHFWYSAESIFFLVNHVIFSVFNTAMHVKLHIKSVHHIFFSFLWTLWFYAVYDRALFKVHPKSVHILCLSCEPCYFLYEMQQCQSQYKHQILCNLVKTVYNAYYSTLTRKKHESDHNHNFFICEL